MEKMSTSTLEFDRIANDTMPVTTGSSPLALEYHNLEEDDELSLHSFDQHHAYSPRSERRRTSTFTSYTGISSIPPSIAPGQIPAYTPHKHRKIVSTTSIPNSPRGRYTTNNSPFATPGSPNPRNGTPRRRGMVGELGHHFDLIDFQSPGSTRSHSVATRSVTRSSIGSRCTTPSQHKENLPLVLLHVTVLPSTRRIYSRELLEKVGAGPHIMENQELLTEKLSDMIRQRGLLLPHPGEEYDLLEERLLESLELCAPRVLDCGHFYGGDDLEEDVTSENGITTMHEPGFVHTMYKSHSRKSDSDSGFDSNSDDDICNECYEPIHLPNRGVGHGKQRWDLRIYAANGMMRAGAWAAAWREMERVDVEIDVWMPEEMRRMLDKAQLEEERTQHLKSVEEGQAHIDRMHREREEVLEAKLLDAAHASAVQLEVLVATEQVARAAEMRIKDLELDVASLKTALATPIVAEPIHIEESMTTKTTSRSRSRPRSYSPHSKSKVPLSTLLRNYIFLLAQDRRNIALVVLMAAFCFVSWMSIVGGRHTSAIGAVTGRAHTSSPVHDLAQQGVDKVMHDMAVTPFEMGEMGQQEDIDANLTVGQEVTQDKEEGEEAGILNEIASLLDLEDVIEER